MDDGRLAEELISVGREAGLAAVGICDASRFEDTRRILVERRSRGWAAGMQFTYRRPERSTDPQVTLPGAAALVVGACRYERDEGATPVGRDASRGREVRDDPGGRDGRRPHGAGEDETGGAPVAVLADRRPRARVAMYSWVDHYRVLRDALGAVADHLLRCRMAGAGGRRRQCPGRSGRRRAGRPGLVRQEHQRAPSGGGVLVCARARSSPTRL